MQAPVCVLVTMENASWTDTLAKKRYIVPFESIVQHLPDCWVIVMRGVFDTDHCNASFCNQHAEQLAEIYYLL